MSVTPEDPDVRASQAAASGRPPADPRICGDPHAHSRARRVPTRHAPASGTHRTRAPRRRLATLAAVAALVLSPLLPAPAARAADTPTPAPSPSSTPLSGTADTFLSTTAGGVLTPHRDLSAWITLRNGTDYSVAESTVSLSLGTTALQTRAAVTAWLNSSDNGDDDSPSTGNGSNGSNGSNGHPKTTGRPPPPPT